MIKVTSYKTSYKLMIGYLIGLFNPKGHEAIKAPFATNFKLYILAVITR